MEIHNNSWMNDDNTKMMIALINIVVVNFYIIYF